MRVLAIILTLLLPIAAQAQSNRHGIPIPLGPIGQKVEQDLAGARSTITGQPAAGAPLDKLMSALSKPFQDLADFIASDAAGAAALAVQVPGLQDTNGQACWRKMQDAGAVFQAHPVPVTLKVMTDFEALRLLQMTSNNLCAYTPCTVVFGDATNLATSVAASVGGILTSANVPSLTAICSRIPQLAPMLPDAATGLSKMVQAAAPSPAASPSASLTPSPIPSPTAPQ